MAQVYGVGAIILALILFIAAIAGVQTKQVGDTLEDKLLIGLMVANIVLLLTAGMDWLNLTPEM